MFLSGGSFKKEMENKSFKTSLGAELSVEEVINEVSVFMAAEKNCRYKIIIGSDSDARSGITVDFITAIVVHRVGNGGRYFWRRLEMDRFHTLRDRIIQEVLLSIDVAKEILVCLKKLKTPEFDFEIHVDVGENGKTKEIIQEVVGMVRAYNFEPRTKPESYAASKVADRHV